jgi:hypothetical protein
MNLTDKEKHAYTTYKEWKKENKDATTNSFFDVKRDFSVGTLWSARSKMGDHEPKKRKGMSEETKKKISLKVKTALAVKKQQAPAMQTLVVPEPMSTDKAVVIVCNISQIKDVLHGLT